MTVRSNVGQCRSCKATIEWARWFNSGKPVPLEPFEDVRGNIEVLFLDEGGTPLVRLVPVSEREGKLLRLTHFAVCPYASQHRRR